jgi:radical SAM protein with 4Fe4S-binding SPASM domain
VPPEPAGPRPGGALARLPPAVEPLEEIGLRDLFREWDVGPRRLAVDGVLETTFRCNLRCVHCYVNQPAGSPEARASELSLERLCGLIDEIAAAGCLNLLLTGGEVLVRPDFPQLYLHALGRGLLVTVFTNGTLVTKAIADLLDAHRPLLVEISLYGMSRETYERVTGVPGSYDKCRDGIRRLVERGVPLKLKTMAMTWNQHELAAMRDFAASLGLGFRYDGLLNPRVDCGANRNGELQLPAEAMLALELADPDQRRRLESSCEDIRRADPDRPPSERVYTCGAGQNTFTIDPSGRLQMCQLSRRAAFDLGAGRFEDGWNGLFADIRARRWQTDPACRRCNLTALCGSCPGAAEMETGDLESIVPRFCEIAHARAWALMRAESGHREDATCCLGQRRPAPLPGAGAAAGCGSCGHAASAPRPIRLERRRRAAAS